MDTFTRDTDMTPPPAGPAERKAIHAYLSPEAHGIWQEFADENGVSMSGVLEAVSVVLRTDPNDPNVGSTPLTTVLATVVKTARKIDAERRRRGRS